MEFVLTFEQPLAIYERNADPATGPEGLAPWALYMKAMSEAGVLRAASRLDVLNGTRVSVRGGKRLVQDGPFADTEDLLGGFALIDVASLDEALRWAERAPCSAPGATGVYPVKQPGTL